jgi:N-acetylneuraminic acid mutarotase
MRRNTRFVAGLSAALALMVFTSVTAWAITWSLKAGMPTGRSGLAAAVGTDVNGTIYVVGGYNGADLNNLEAYNPHTNTWAIKKSMPTPRSGVAAATGKDGMIYAFGGYHTIVRNTVEAYNPRTNTWTAKRAMPTGRSDLAAVAAKDGKIYVIGGWATRNGFNDPVALTTVQAYDPVTNTWAAKAPMPTPRYWLAAVLGSDGKIYAIGGESTTTTSLQNVEAYNPVTNVWTKVAPMPNTTQGRLSITGRNALGAAAGKTKIYAIGGTEEDFIPLGTVQSYTLATGKWASEAPLPTVRGYLAAAASGTLIYAIGGYNHNTVKPCAVTGYCRTVEASTAA